MMACSSDPELDEALGEAGVKASSGVDTIETDDGKEGDGVDITLDEEGSGGASAKGMLRLSSTWRASNCMRD